MADVLANGFGSVAGTRASPVVLLSSASLPAGANSITINNIDATNWLFVRVATHKGLFVVALPGKSATVIAGGPVTDGITTIEGFGATPSEAGTATVVGVVAGLTVV